VILVTPPPVNEYSCEENDRNKGIAEPRRLAKVTAEYAERVRELAQELKSEGVDIVLLDLWKVMMQHAGASTETSPLPGSKEIPENVFLKLVLHDGMGLNTSLSAATADKFIGLHFTNIAYTLYFTEMMRIIEQTWPNQLPNDKNLPYTFPAWDNRVAWDAKKLTRYE